MGSDLLKRGTIHLLAFVWFFTLTLATRWPILSTLSSAYLGGFSGDGGLYVWLFEESLNSLSAENWFTTNAFYPYGRTLAWSDNFILPSILGTLLQWCGLSKVLSYNVLLLSGIFLSGVTTYLLSTTLFGSFPAAVFAGTSMLSFHFLAEHTGHPQLQFLFFVPLTLLFTHRCITKRSLADGILVGLTVGCAFLTSVYYAIFGVLAGAAYCLSLFIVRPRTRLNTLVVLPVTAAFSLLAFLPFVVPYLQVKEEFGSRNLYEAYYFSTHLLSYLSTGPHSLLYATTAPLSHGEAHLFPGFVLLTVVGLGIVTFARVRFSLLIAVLFLLCSLALNLPNFGDDTSAKALSALCAWGALVALGVSLFQARELDRREQHGVALLSVALSFVLLSLGPLGNPALGHKPFSPFTLLYYVVPGVDGIRAAGRFGLVAHLALSLVGGWFLVRLSKKVKWSPLVLAPLVCIVLPLEHLTTTYPVEERPDLPQVLEKATFKEGEVVLFLPFSTPLKEDGTIAHWSDFARRNIRAAEWARQLGLRTVNGYSGLRTKIMREYPRWTAGFPDARSCRALRRLVGLQYVVFEGAPAESASCLTERSQDSEFTLYELGGVQQLAGREELTLPPLAKGLTFEFGECEGKPPPASVSVAIKDYYEFDVLEELPFEREVSIELPQSPQYVRPRYLEISVGDRCVEWRVELNE